MAVTATALFSDEQAGWIPGYYLRSEEIAEICLRSQLQEPFAYR